MVNTNGPACQKWLGAQCRVKMAQLRNQNQRRVYSIRRKRGRINKSSRLVRGDCAPISSMSALKKGFQMKCSTCGGSGAVDSGGFIPFGSPINVPCPDCSQPWAIFPAELTPPTPEELELESEEKSQQQIYVRNLELFISKKDWQSQLLDLGMDYDDFTCAKCWIADKCRSAFDSYNTNGDCLEEK